MAARPSGGLITRRTALGGFAGAACLPLVHGLRAATAETGPVFSRGGPNAEHYGAAENYPVPGWLRSRLEGNPFRPKYRVGAFSHIDEIYPTRLVARASTPWSFKRAPAAIRYRFRGSASSIEEYLARNPSPDF